MQNYVLQFSAEVADEVNRQVELAKVIWIDAQPTLAGLAITAGNYAGYGGYLARCHSNGVIEIPIGNSFSLLKIDQSNQLIHAEADHHKMLGTLLHEIGHHVVNTSTQTPWAGNVSVGQSTHMHASWVWICVTAWNHLHGRAIDCNEYARAALADNQLRLHLSEFNPYVLPPFDDRNTKRCDQCGSEIHSRRSDAKFCCAACRVAFHRTKPVIVANG